MRLIIFLLSMSFSCCLLAQQDTAVSWFDKARKMPLDSLDFYQFIMLCEDFNVKNLEEAKPVFDSLSRKTDKNVLYQKRTMSIVQLRSKPNLSSATDRYGVFTDDFLKNPSCAQFEEDPYYPGEYKPVALFRELCDNISDGLMVAYRSNNILPYSIEEFNKAFYYYEIGEGDSPNTIVWRKEYCDSLPYGYEWNVYNYIVIEDWVCDNNMNFYSKIVAIAPIRIVLSVPYVCDYCCFDQEILFWLFF